MLEEYVDKLIEDVISNVDIQTIQPNSLKYFSCQTSLYSVAITLLNEKLIDHQFQSLKEEISFFKNQKPRLLAEQHYSHYRAEALQDCQNLSKEARDEYFRYQIQRIDAFFSEHKEFGTYLALGNHLLDKQYFTRLSNRSFLNVDYYLVDKDFRTTCEKGHIMGKIISKKRLSIYFQSQLKKEPIHLTSDGINSTKNLNWNSSPTDLVELIYALKISGCINDTLSNISEVMSQVFGIGPIDTYKTWSRIKSRKKNPTQLLSRLLESLSEQIKEENE